MQGLGNFAAGFLGAFTAAKNQKKQREQDEQEQKAKVKLFEIQLAREKAALAREQEQQGAMQDVFSRLQGGSRLQSNPNITLGDPRPQMTLTEMLADAQMQGTLMQAGLAGPQDIVKANAKPELPADIQELLFLRDNPEIAALDQRRRAASATTVNNTVNSGGDLPKPPAGYFRPEKGKPGLAMEVGGPEWMAAQMERAKANAASQSAGVKAGLMMTTIEDAKKLSNFGTTGLIGKAIAGVPGSEAYTLAKTIETLKSNLAFGALQEMRANSPTGGALGAVSERELSLLESAITSLDPGLPEKVLRRNLERVEKHFANWQKAVEDARKAQADITGGAVVDFSALPE